MNLKSFLKILMPRLIASFLVLFFVYGCEMPNQGDESESQEVIQLPPIAQVGVVVHDVDKAVAHYTQLGLGPFHVMEVEVDGFIYRGTVAPHKLKIGLSPGNPQIELIETLEGRTPNTDFLKLRGEGISHYGFNVSMEEYEAILAAWAKRGISPIFYRDEPNRRIAYLNTDRTGGVMTELVGTK